MISRFLSLSAITGWRVKGRFTMPKSIPDSSDIIDAETVPSQDLAHRSNLPDVISSFTDVLAALQDNADNIMVFEGMDAFRKERLISIPFVITKIECRCKTGIDSAPGYVVVSAYILNAETVQGRLNATAKMDERKGNKIRSAYATVEDMIDDGLRPESLIVFSDGSTGVRRQIVELLVKAGLVSLGTSLDIAKMKAPADQSFGDWLKHSGTEERDGDSLLITFDRDANSGPLLMLAPRGLRASTYNTDLSPDGEATTFYIA